MPEADETGTGTMFCVSPGTESTVQKRQDDLELRLSISIGVAMFPDDANTAEALTRAADAALYRAKAKGRDVVSD